MLTQRVPGADATSEGGFLIQGLCSTPSSTSTSTLSSPPSVATHICLKLGNTQHATHSLRNAKLHTHMTRRTPTSVGTFVCKHFPPPIPSSKQLWSILSVSFYFPLCHSLSLSGLLALFCEWGKRCSGCWCWWGGVCVCVCGGVQLAGFRWLIHRLRPVTHPPPTPALPLSDASLPLHFFLGCNAVVFGVVFISAHSSCVILFCFVVILSCLISAYRVRLFVVMFVPSKKFWLWLTNLFKYVNK